MVRAEVETWTSRRGPDWSDLMIRIAAAGPSPWVIYTTASAALVVILFSAYLVGSWLQIGALAQPINSHLH
jgi:cytochrome c-type biogenesis protein CcmH/NrfG